MSPENRYLVTTDLPNSTAAEETRERIASLPGVRSVELLEIGCGSDKSENTFPNTLEGFDQLNFGQTVKLLRLSLGISQRELSERGVLARSVVGQFERGAMEGKNLESRTILRVIKAFPWPIEDPRSQLLVKKAHDEGYKISPEQTGTSSSRSKLRRVPVASEKLLKQVAPAYDAGASYREMSSVLNVSEADVAYAVRKLVKKGLVRRRAHSAPRRSKEDILSFDAQVKIFYDKGLEYVEIVEALASNYILVKKSLERLDKNKLIQRRNKPRSLTS